MPQKSARQEPNDALVKERLRYLVKNRWEDTLAKMAKALRLSQPGLWKIVHGKLPLNAKVLVALATYTNVNIHWLVTGHGPHNLDGPGALVSGKAVVRPKVPVAKQLLMGKPEDHPDDWDEPSFDPLGVLSPTQYWIEVKRADHIVRYEEEQIRPGDWLLLETDPVRFPSQDQMDGKLVVVLGSGQGKVRTPALARVLDVGDDNILDVKRFDRGIDPKLLEDEIVVRKQSDGKYRAFTRKVLSGRPTAKGRRREPDRVVDRRELLKNYQWIRYADILAVCVLCVGQP